MSEIPWKSDESYLRPADPALAYATPVRAETALVGLYELVALTLPAGLAIGPCHWMIYGPPHLTTLVKSDDAATFDAAKAAAEAALTEIRCK